MYPKELAVEALTAHREAPEELGRALRALRLLQSMGGAEVAREVALAFVRLHDGDERAGEAVMAFARQAPEKLFAAGDTLTTEGDVDDHIFVLMEGEVGVHRLGVGELARLGPGASVGEIAPVSGTARTASVHARAQTRALCIPGFALAQLREHFPATTDLVARHARARLLTQLIPESSPFDALPGPEREAFFDRLAARTVPEGSVLVRAGLPSSGLYLIASGHAKASCGQGADARPLGRFGPGEFFGEASLLFDGPEPADVVAETTLTVFMLALDDLRLVLYAHRAVSPGLVKLSRGRLTAAGLTPPSLVRWLRDGPKPALVVHQTPLVISRAPPPVRMRGAKVSAARSPPVPAAHTRR